MFEEVAHLKPALKQQNSKTSLCKIVELFSAVVIFPDTNRGKKKLVF